MTLLGIGKLVLLALFFAYAVFYIASHFMGDDDE